MQVFLQQRPVWGRAPGPGLMGGGVTDRPQSARGPLRAHSPGRLLGWVQLRQDSPWIFGLKYQHDRQHFRGKKNFIFFFPFLAAPQQMEFLGQGSDMSRIYDLYCSCGNTSSFNPPCQARNGTCVLVLLNCRTTVGISRVFYFFIFKIKS